MVKLRTKRISDEVISMDRISWTDYFMAQSLVISTRSTCDRLMVGAVIVRNNRIIATGYNGSVSGLTHCIDHGCFVVDGHCIRTIHAEVNAVIQCAKMGISTDGAEIYITHFPCYNCSKVIIQAGIKKVHYLYDYHNDPNAIDLFSECDIQVSKHELSPHLFEQIKQLHLTNIDQQ